MDGFKNWLNINDIFDFKNRNTYNADPNKKVMSDSLPNPDQTYFGRHKDIFGFKKLSKLPPVQPDDKPIKQIEVSKIIKTLEKRKLGGKKVYEKFHDSLCWGRDCDTVGAIELDLSPLGSWKVYINKLCADIKGNPIWIMEQAVPLVDFVNEDKEVEDKIIDVLWENLEKINEKKLETPKKEYDLLPLIKSCMTAFQKERPIWFVFEGTKQISDTRWIVYFSFRGAGAGLLHPNDYRAEQFNIDINFKPKEGIINIFGYNIVSPMKVHEWIPSVKEFEANFMPSQSVFSILHSLLHLTHCY